LLRGVGYTRLVLGQLLRLLILRFWRSMPRAKVR
jgi:hypothetical protein